MKKIGRGKGDTIHLWQWWKGPLYRALFSYQIEPSVKRMTEEWRDDSFFITIFIFVKCRLIDTLLSYSLEKCHYFLMENGRLSTYCILGSSEKTVIAHSIGKNLKEKFTSNGKGKILISITCICINWEVDMMFRSEFIFQR